jgi:hypothetical protein
LHGRCQQCHESVAADAVAGEGKEEAGDEGLLLGESWMDLTGPPAGASNRSDAVDRPCHKTTHELVEEHSKVCHSGRESSQVLRGHSIPPPLCCCHVCLIIFHLFERCWPGIPHPPLSQPIKGRQAGRQAGSHPSSLTPGEQPGDGDCGPGRKHWPAEPCIPVVRVLHIASAQGTPSALSPSPLPPSPSPCSHKRICAV